MNKKVLVLLSIATACAGVLLFSNNAHAGATLDKIGKKSEVQGVKGCYVDHKIGKKLQSNYGSKKMYEANEPQVMTELKPFTDYREIAPFRDAKAKVLLPNGLTDEANGSNDHKTNCNHLIDGADSKIGSGGDGFKESVFKRFGKEDPSPSSKDLVKTMENVGYKPADGEGGDSSQDASCIHVSYKYGTNNAGGAAIASETTDTRYYYQNRICPEFENGKVVRLNESEETDTETYKTRGYSKMGYPPIFTSNSRPDGNDNQLLGFALKNFKAGGMAAYCRIPFLPTCGTYEDQTYINLSTWNGTWPEAVEALRGILSKVNKDTAQQDGGIFGGHAANTTDGDGRYTYFYDVEVEMDSETNNQKVTNNWKILDNREDAANNVVKYLGYSTKKGTNNSMRLTKSEVVVLYQYYITGVAKFEVSCEEDDIENSAFAKVQWFHTPDERKECAIKGSPDEYQGATFSGVGNPDGAEPTAGIFFQELALSDVVKELGKIDIDKLVGVDESELAEIQQMAIQNPDKEATAIYDCYSRAESLGWVLCPIIDNLGDYIQNTYEQHITNFLVLDAGLFENGSTLQAWRSFQTIANVFFVVVFLVVILSQLTGFGIDNYGIKKILPKLIAGAILINLSYFICQLAIEVANIVGYGIGQIFESIGTQITEVKISEAANIASNSTGTSHSGAGAVAIIVVLVAALVAGAVLAIGPSVLVPIFLGLIAIAIAILACFVILAVRKALAVVLVVISPVAFVCYMLPNTKSLFRRWLKAFEGVIIAFPVCSAMIYGGQAVSRLIINGSGSTTVPFMLALSAAVIAVIPMYFIPRVVSRSMGAISAGINGVANRARATGQRRYRESDHAQDLARQSQLMRNRRAAGQTRVSGALRKVGDRMDDARMSTRVGRALFTGRHNARNQRLANANARYARDVSENDKAERMLDQRNLDSQMFNDRVKNYMDSAQFEADTGNGNTDTMMTALLGLDMSSEEGRVKARAIGKALSATKDGKKRLISGIRDGSINGDLYKELSKDSSIRSNIHDKDQFVATAMASADSQDWKKWSGNESNMQNVVKNLDKSDLYSQGSAAFQDALNTKKADGSGEYMISNERLQTDMGNPNIDMGDKRDIITSTNTDTYGGAARGLSASDPNAKLADAMNNLAGEMKINREKGTLSGGYPGGPSLSGHNAQQQSKNNGGGGGGIGNAGNIPT